MNYTVAENVNPSSFKFIFNVPHSCQFCYKKNKRKKATLHCKMIILLKELKFKTVQIYDFDLSVLTNYSLITSQFVNCYQMWPKNAIHYPLCLLRTHHTS